jgi:hypothetical protein
MQKLEGNMTPRKLLTTMRWLKMNNVPAIRKIINNAAFALKIWSNFGPQGKVSKNKFSQYFHFRPTTDGITIVSTLPFAPMRGISVSNSELKHTIDELMNCFPTLMGEDDKKALALLASFGFNKRTSGKHKLEEDRQAQMIRGMVNNESNYNGLQFVASELIVEKTQNNRDCRFDIVAIKDKTLCLLELKKDRTTKAPEQVRRYMDFYIKNEKAIRQLLETYPNNPIKDYEQIKGIAVMRLSENTKSKMWEDLKKKFDVAIWFYEESLAFSKV